MKFSSGSSTETSMSSSISSSRIWKTFTLGCASAQTHHQTTFQKLKFNVPLSIAFKNNTIPDSLLMMLRYLSQEGVTAPDIFRRPGNPADQRRLMKKLSEGRNIVLAEYNFYTVASVLKKFLIGIPGGLFGKDLEYDLLKILEIDSQLKQFDRIHELLSQLPEVVQQFLALLFGLWFRVVNHIEFHSMSSEAMAKSVTGSVFHNSAADPALVKKAAKVMEILIENYAISTLFGSQNLQFFADVTSTGIVITEKFTYHYKYPSHQNIEKEASLRSFAQHLRQECSSRGLLNEDDAAETAARVTHSSTPSPLLPSSAHRGMMGCSSVPDVNTHHRFKSQLSLQASQLDRHISKSLTKFDTIKIRQMARLKKRSDWFLSNAGTKSPQAVRKLTMTSESDATESCHDEQRSEVESVFDDRRSIDTNLQDKTLYEEPMLEYRDDDDTTPDCNDNSETLTKHFIKQTTIVPRKTIIPC